MFGLIAKAGAHVPTERRERRETEGLDFSLVRYTGIKLPFLPALAERLFSETGYMQALGRDSFPSSSEEGSFLPLQGTKGNQIVLI